MIALKFILLFFLPNACKNSDMNACNIRTCALTNTWASQQYSGKKYQYCGHYLPHTIVKYYSSDFMGMADAYPTSKVVRACS
jgi:hypothetical protein